MSGSAAPSRQRDRDGESVLASEPGVVADVDEALAQLVPERARGPLRRRAPAGVYDMSASVSADTRKVSGVEAERGRRRDGGEQEPGAGVPEYLGQRLRRWRAASWRAGAAPSSTMSGSSESLAGSKSDRQARHGEADDEDAPQGAVRREGHEQHEDHARDLGGQHDVALVEAVDDDAGEHPEQQVGQGVDREDDAGRERRAGRRVDEPGEGDACTRRSPICETNCPVHSRTKLRFGHSAALPLSRPRPIVDPPRLVAVELAPSHRAWWPRESRCVDGRDSLAPDRQPTSDVRSSSIERARTGCRSRRQAADSDVRCEDVLPVLTRVVQSGNAVGRIALLASVDFPDRLSAP